MTQVTARIPMPLRTFTGGAAEVVEAGPRTFGIWHEPDGSKSSPPKTGASSVRDSGEPQNSRGPGSCRREIDERRT